MANSYLNIVTFLFTTLFYYMAIKPNLTLNSLIDPVQYKKYMSSSYMYLAVYLLLVMVIQFIVNASVITSNCGGNITENMGAAGIYTFIPWILIFGVVILVLTIYPGFKSAFSDVIGYFYVSSSANKVLTTLLIDKDVQKKIDTDTTSTEEQKKSMQEAADAIIKICGNTSILINQIVPSNFMEYWNILTPLMKTQYQTSGPETEKLKSELFELVVTRDNVGEAMWFMYTGLLLTSIVQLKLTTRGCTTNPDTMQKNYQSYLQQQETADKQQQQATGTVYTVSG
uniref:Uncharacterized protein n=1 Tax=viral metagenome TaxID=1070528 RepID=A0A6C0ESN1_9ZZZZ